jgi:AAA domain
LLLPFCPAGKKCRSQFRLQAKSSAAKYRRWRNYLKGLYDGRPKGQRILVTGSARLDLYRFGGDSLQGRYHFLRLHPFLLAELGESRREVFRDLLRLGVFQPVYSAMPADFIARVPPACCAAGPQ